MADLTPDYNKRDCLLPLGCKDLLDVLLLKDETPHEETVEESSASASGGPKAQAAPQQPSIIEIGDGISVKELALLLDCPPYRIMATLISWKIFLANADKMLPFEVAAKVSRKHGCDVRRAD